MTCLVNYIDRFVLIHFMDVVMNAIIFVYPDSEPLQCIASKEIQATNFVKIPLPDVKGKYLVHIRINDEEIVKSLIIP